MKSDGDISLLRRFEPVLCYTRGEQFFPMPVERYVSSCSLWTQRPDEEPVCLIPQGLLTLDRLARMQPDRPDSVHFLKVSEPLSASKLAAYKFRKSIYPEGRRDAFHAGMGRLARVGYVSRFIDALFAISLLARGRVPGDTAAAASIVYSRLLEEHENYGYYGRVLRQDGWVVLQYWYFYIFNTWRSGYVGANDHEADWEMICIYLTETGEEIKPEWVACAAHDYSGDDLRRRWDDPEVRKEGDHPVVYCGAGSHAAYFSPGEYLTELELHFLSPFARAANEMQAFWHKKLRQYRGEVIHPELKRGANIFHIPFVDYARGDGLTIGPGGQKAWDLPHLLSPPPAWVTGYRGLWGFYARDPFAGENAPAGPMYNRDGTVRQSWYDPVRWAGLDKVAPSNEALRIVLNQQKEVAERLNTALVQVREKSLRLRRLGMEAEAIGRQPHLGNMHEFYRNEIQSISKEVGQLQVQLASDEILIGALENHADRLRAGERGPARAHIQRAFRPTSDVQLRVIRLAELWAAISIGVMLIGLVVLTLFARSYLFIGLVGILALFIVIEAGFRGRLIRLVTFSNIGFTIAATFIILYEFFWHITVLAIVSAGIYIVWDNMRELWR
jgi:hypothetical protein